MKWSRREFLRALGRSLASLTVLPLRPASSRVSTQAAAGGAPYATELGGNAWAIGNDLVEQRVAFSAGGLFTTSMIDKLSGRDWCASAVSPVFLLSEEGADLNSAAGWTYAASEVSASSDEATLKVSVQHTARPIRVRACFHIWPDTHAVRMWTEYENLGTAPRRLEGQSFCNLVLTAAGDLETVWVAPFSWDSRYTGDAFVVHRETLKTGEQRRLVIGPYAADDKNPDDVTQRLSCGWFALHRPAIGAGLFCGVEWSGACQARAALNDAGQGEIGVAHGRPSFTHITAPGERIASPVAFIGLFEGSLDEATHLTRELATRYYVPRRAGGTLRLPPGAEFPYVMADTWCYGPNIDEAGLRAFIDRAAEIGVELITIDEGWEARIGDWTSHPARFPSGLRATVDYIHSKGMGAGLWFAFGNVDPNSQVAKDHPDWLATRDGTPIVASFNTNVLCLSHAAARAWVAAELDRIIGEYDVDWLVQDFETIARCDTRSAAHEHQAGDAEYRNVLALWELIAGVRARHPNVFIENNWSGGRVMDFGMLRLYDTSLCDDYNMAARNRVASFGATHFFPPAFLSKYMSAEPYLPLDYQTRSFFVGGPWNLMIDLPASDAAALAEAVRAYKSLRAIIRDGRIYHLIAPNPPGLAWDAIQAVEAGAQRAVILVGRGLGGAPTFKVRPPGLDAASEYYLISSSGATYGKRSGADVMLNGIDVSLPERSTETILLMSQLTHSIFLPLVTRGG